MSHHRLGKYIKKVNFSRSKSVKFATFTEYNEYSNCDFFTIEKHLLNLAINAREYACGSWDQLQLCMFCCINDKQKDPSSMLTLIPCTLIWPSRPAAETYTLSHNWHELHVGCWSRACVKSDSICLLTWDPIWQTSLTLNKQTLLQRLQAS